MQSISHFEKISHLKTKNFAFHIKRKTKLKRFNLIPRIEIFSHSTPIIPRESFQVECENIWRSFGVGDHFGSSLRDLGDHFGSGIIWGGGSFRVVYRWGI